MRDPESVKAELEWLTLFHKLRAEQNTPKGEWPLGLPPHPTRKYGVKLPQVPLRPTTKRRTLQNYIMDLETTQVLETADPVEWLIKIFAIGKDPLVEAAIAEGKIDDPKGTAALIPLDIRIDAAKAAAPYVRPKLSAMQVTGKDDGPVEIAQVVNESLMSNPQFRNAMEQVVQMASEAGNLEDAQQAAFDENSARELAKELGVDLDSYLKE